VITRLPFLFVVFCVFLPIKVWVSYSNASHIMGPPLFFFELEPEIYFNRISF